MDELDALLVGVGYPVNVCIFARPNEVCQLVLGKDFVEIVDALALHCHVADLIVAEYHRIIDLGGLGGGIDRYDRLQLLRIKAIVAYVSGAFDFVTFSGIWEQIKRIHASYAASCGQLVDLGEPLSMDITSSLFGNYCPKEAVFVRLLQAGVVTQAMKDTGNYGDSKTGLSFGQYTQEAPARFLEKAGFHLTARPKFEPPKELRLNNAHKHVTAHCAENNDFDSHDDAQKRDADAYCACVRMVNSKAMRFMTCTSTHIAQYVLFLSLNNRESRLVSWVPLVSCLKSSRRFQILTTSTKLRLPPCSVTSWDLRCIQRCAMMTLSAKLKSTTGSNSLHAMDRAITNFILNLHFVQHLSLEHNVDIHNHVSDFFSWKGGISSA
jgi:hypothetical protein